MRIEPRHLHDVADGEDVQLLHTSTASAMYRQQDRPCEAESNETDDPDDFEVAEEEEAIK